MDGVEEVKDLRYYFPTINASFATLPDPVYTPFNNGLKVFKGEALILTVCTLVHILQLILTFFILSEWSKYISIGDLEFV